ncbi:hypothetical protein FB567DRAFT_621381 [Paraphoma chrysanthemicola]|uniref:Uncharacterized protein n=1 Tax=Paraphoma chrysanthemicola TaxID=798071 RepID=A0A8K0R7P4_9PLEO|nr:hypothetical protein FB567DRAFT_621381 [Paraphoma chrysanthemicola]
MSQRHARFAAPQAPSMLPARKANNASTNALRLLRNSLGQNAGLLDHLPVNDIQMVLQTDAGMESCINHKICLGAIPDENGGEPWTVWVYMSDNMRKDGLPDLRTVASHSRSGKLKSYNQREIVSKCKFRDEFEKAALKRSFLFVVLKASPPVNYCYRTCELIIKQACFILKGCEIPHGLEITDGFASDLIHACRKYEQQGLNGSGKGDSDSTSNKICSPPRTRPSIRKSEQRGPNMQRFEALTKNEANLKPLTPLHAVSPVSPSFPGSSLASGPNQATATHQLQACGKESPISSEQMLQEPDTEKQYNILEAPKGPASMRNLNEYLEIRGRNEDVSDEIEHIKSKIKEVDADYWEKRQELCTFIDQELKHMHGEKLREIAADYQARYDKIKADFEAENKKVRAEQVVEVQERKAGYAQLKKEHEQQVQGLRDLEKEKVQLKRSLEHELDQKQKNITMDQLLDFVHTQGSARKKAKLEHVPKDEDDQDMK